MTPRFRLAVVVVLACSPVLAHAQPPAPGWYLIPSAAVTEEYDSNLFGTRTDRTSDFITRLTGGLALGYRSEPLTVLGSYLLGSEIYAENSSLNNVGDRQRARLLFEYRPERRVELRLDGSYRRTNRITHLVLPEPAPAGADVQGAPGTESSPEPGVPPPGVASVEIGRRRVEVVRVAPSVSYELAPLVSAEAAYTFRHIDLEDSPATTENVLRLSLARELTPLDTGRVTYRFRYFDLGADSGNTYSNAVTLGWERRVTPRLSLDVAAGPRLDEDETVSAEARARVSYRFQPTTVFLAYSRTQEIAVGLVGPQTVDRFAGGVVWRPLAAVVAGLTGSVHLVSSDEGDGSSRQDTIYRLSAHLAYRLTRWLTARGRYDFSLEQEDRRSGDILSHVVSLTLEFEEPFRIY